MRLLSSPLCVGRFLSGASRLLRNLVHRNHLEEDLHAEVSSYLAELTDQKIHSGLHPTAARREALLELGGIEQIKENVREIRMGNLIETMIQDIRYGLRTLRKNPGFTGTVVLTLALGIAANTTMYSVAYSILARPLPYPAADRVALVYMHFSPQNFEHGTMSLADYLDWKSQNRSFETPSIFSNRRMDLTGKGEPEQVQGALVTSGFFSTLATPPLMGRTFDAAQDQPGAPTAAVLSESLWRRRFSADPAVLGQSITVNGSAATIIGVMPQTFQMPRGNVQVWTNLTVVPPTRRGPFFYRGIARLKPGVSLEQAQRDTNAIGQRIMQQNPYYRNLTLPIEPLRRAIVGDVRTPLLVLSGAVGMVLLIAMVNVANLLLARAASRETEIALRISLGASRLRLARQLLTESLLLSLAGGTLGLALSYLAIPPLRAWNPGNLPLFQDVRLDGSALAFTFALSLITGLLFGLAPVLQSARADLRSNVRASTQSTLHTRTVLVVAEIALSLMLMAGAGLLLRSLQHLQQVNAGFAAPPRQILTIAVSPSDRKYSQPPAFRALYQDMLERAAQVPGIDSVSVSDSLPPDNQSDADTFAIEGQVLKPDESNPAVSVAIVSPDYFRTMRIPLLRGRLFTAHDRADAPLVTIISESLARHFFPGQDPIGRHLAQSSAQNNNPYMEIVGVVGDVKYTGLDKDTDAAYYMPFTQNEGRRMFVVARSAQGGSAAQALRRAVQSADPGVTLNQVGTLEESLSQAVALPRFDTLLLAAFAALALLLAALGIYGIVAYSVARRTHEIGVRMALGAGRTSVLALIIRQGATLAVAGIAFGLAGAFGLTRLLGNLLFGVSSSDPVTFVIVTLSLLAVVLLASFLPAHRATRISAVESLRCD
jgi:putative ABC transport system permease protein